jgi:hypothetical protein
MNIGDFNLDPAALLGSRPTTRCERAPNEMPVREGARAIVREALIPFVVWPDVPVRTLEPRQLGRMEVFLLEAGLELGTFDLSELEDATAVPAKVIAASADRLLRTGTFVQVAPEEYVVNQDEAKEILTAKNIEEEHRRLVTFAYFPRQDIVIANAEVAGQLLNVTRKLRAPRKAPFPAHLDRTASAADFLESRIEEERVFGFAHRLLRVDEWSKPPPWPNQAPCYYGRGYVTGVGDNAVADMQIWGYPRRKAAPRTYHGETVRLAGVQPLIQEWASLADAFGSAFPGFVPGLPALSAERMESIGPCQWRLGVSHEETNALAVDRWLTEPLSISICSPTAKVDVRLSFEPTDAGAAEFFALDAVAQRIDEQRLPHSDRNLAEHVRSALERYQLSARAEVTRERVEERLWSLKRFMAVYLQRASEDFAYA